MCVVSLASVCLSFYKATFSIYSLNFQNQRQEYAHVSSISCQDKTCWSSNIYEVCEKTTFSPLPCQTRLSYVVFVTQLNSFVNQMMMRSHVRSEEPESTINTFHTFVKIKFYTSLQSRLNSSKFSAFMNANDRGDSLVTNWPTTDVQQTFSVYAGHVRSRHAGSSLSFFCGFNVTHRR